MVLCLLAPVGAQAKVRLSQTKPIQIPVNELERPITTQDVQKIIPMNMRPTSSTTAVLTRVGDRALTTWLNSAAIQDSALGRTKNQVEETMKTEVSVAGTGEGANKVEHKVSFQVLALQATTRMTYKGWVNAEVNHDVRSRATQVQISEKVWNNKDVTLSHMANSDEGISSVGVRWSF